MASQFDDNDERCVRCARHRSLPTGAAPDSCHARARGASVRPPPRAERVRVYALQAAGGRGGEEELAREHGRADSGPGGRSGLVTEGSRVQGAWLRAHAPR